MVDSHALHGTWLHSREEDAGENEVFRPESYDFPPSRGRTGYSFDANGTVRVLGPGADDRSTAQSGTWSLSSDGRLTITSPGGGARELSVASAEPDKLVLKP